MSDEYAGICISYSCTTTWKPKRFESSSVKLTRGTENLGRFNSAQVIQAGLGMFENLILPQFVFLSCSPMRWRLVWPIPGRRRNVTRNQSAVQFVRQLIRLKSSFISPRNPWEKSLLDELIKWISSEPARRWADATAAACYLAVGALLDVEHLLLLPGRSLKPSSQASHTTTIRSGTSNETRTTTLRVLTENKTTISE